MNQNSTRVYTPSHPTQFSVEFKPGNYNSRLVSRRDFAANEIIARIENATRSAKAYSTVQCGQGKDDHIELNSDLLYANHSCDPNIAFDLSSPDPSRWHVRALKPITKGESLCFFYPSTEWEMNQPFTCTCEASTCLREIRGAYGLKIGELQACGYISPWILDAISKRDSEKIATETSP